MSISIGGSEYRETHGIDKVLEICKKSGFDAIDYNFEYHKSGDNVYGGSEDAFFSHFEAIAKKAKELELEIIQTHGRCRTYTPDKTHNKCFLDICEKDFRAASILGSKCCVVHPISNTHWGDLPKEEMREISNKMFENISPLGEKHKVQIAIETCGSARVNNKRVCHFFANPVELKTQFDKIPTNYKTICFDTGHIHEVESMGIPSVDKAIRFLGKDISVLHLHDNFGTHDSHMLPGTGSIHWSDVFDALDSIGYSGTYNLEIKPHLFGKLYAEYLEFVGKYFRQFVDNRGKV